MSPGMVEEGEKVTIPKLIAKTGLSRGFFYKNPMVRQALDKALEQQVGMIDPRRSVLDMAMDNEIVALHERIVKACLQSQGIGYEITTYTQSRNLLYDITDDGFFYDLILLDIEMPGISGMEIPQQLKGFLPNVKIIFVTSHTEYAIDAFELSIFRYVPKNNLEVKLAAAVTDAAKLI